MAQYQVIVTLNPGTPGGPPATLLMKANLTTPEDTYCVAIDISADEAKAISDLIEAHFGVLARFKRLSFAEAAKIAAVAARHVALGWTFSQRRDDLAAEGFHMHGTDGEAYTEIFVAMKNRPD